MPKEKRFLVDVGMNDLPFPMRVVSERDPKGQATIASISISARIMHEFEARWIDKFIEILHRHRDRIGPETLRHNIVDYLVELKASTVKVNFRYPFFIEKITPVSKEKCLVKYDCSYSAKVSSIDNKPKIIFEMSIPVITTYPASFLEKKEGLFGQLSIIHIELETLKDIYPEPIANMVDKHALVPVYSYLSQEDQKYLIHKIHSEAKSSVVTVDEIKNELTYNTDIDSYSVKCSNYGMLHSYNTIIGVEKSVWVPFSEYEAEEI